MPLFTDPAPPRGGALHVPNRALVRASWRPSLAALCLLVSACPGSEYGAAGWGAGEPEPVAQQPERVDPPALDTSGTRVDTLRRRGAHDDAPAATALPNAVPHPDPRQFGAELKEGNES